MKKTTPNAQRPTPNVQLGNADGGGMRASYLVFWQCPSFGPLMGNITLTLDSWRNPTTAEIELLRGRIRKLEKIPDRYSIFICSLVEISLTSAASVLKKKRGAR